MLIEEVAEGGDMLAARARENPRPSWRGSPGSVLAEELYCIRSSAKLEVQSAK
jgi:hypothetical protein